MPPHRFRGGRQTHALWPDLPEDVKYSATYHDAWISYPERLGIELVLDGLAENSEALAVNHLGVTGRNGNRIVLADTLGDTDVAIEADLIVNATGAWIDETNESLFAPDERPAPYVGGTKGSHLVLDHPELMHALNGHMIYFENVDGRVCILYPYLGRVLLGSTDVRVDDPDGVRCEDDEVDYILKSLTYVFPGIEVRPEQIVYRYSGVRPLPRSEAGFTGRISRDHVVAEVAGPPPVLCLVGGKWTTFRAFGEQAADRALEFLGISRRLRTADRQIGGGVGFPTDPAARAAFVADLARSAGVSNQRAAHAVDHYGTGAAAVLASCSEMPDAGLAGSDYTEAELRHLVRNEFARTLSDLLQRRTSLAIRGQLSSAIIARAAVVLAEELGWSADRTTTEEVAFRTLLARDHGLTAEILNERDRNTGSLACV
jgi:glycerol-3-phosphate dehydrogenase